MAANDRYDSLYELLIANTVLWPEDAILGCWVWAASCNTKGYPRYSVRTPLGPRKRFAHIAMADMFYGPILAGHEVDHKCVNKICINPDHLQIVTRKVNLELRDTRRKEKQLRAQTA